MPIPLKDRNSIIYAILELMDKEKGLCASWTIGISADPRETLSLEEVTLNGSNADWWIFRGAENDHEAFGIMSYFVSLGLMRSEYSERGLYVFAYKKKTGPRAELSA